MFNLFFALLVLCGVSVDSARFPEPIQSELEQQEAEVRELGKAEVFGLGYTRFIQFIWDRYWKGSYEETFNYYGTNPTVLTGAQVEKPAIIFLHAQNANHGEWLPLLHRLEDEDLGPKFTINYSDGNCEEVLIQKIEQIRELYLDQGKGSVEIQLVGHSLGATNSADFGYNPTKWPENTTVTKIIAIAGRLKNIEVPAETPYYSYCQDVLVRLDDIWERIQTYRDQVELFTITAAEDWLIPAESIDLGYDDDHRAVIEGRGHLRVVFSKETTANVVKFLKH